ncbi:MAG TPA: formate dehydrogenase [Syntrophomonas sp.]|jgi:formate dehydrogenase subunit gamma|nr:formate dehydrogenase [Syntrophomonas sp.]
MAKEVYRFSAGERFVHWCHGVAFLLLLFTGLGVLLYAFQPAMNIFGGIHVTRNIHRVVAVLFTIGMIVGFIGKGQGARQMRRWFKDVINFGNDDFAHAKNFGIEFFGGHKPFPPQGKFNGGEKLNSMFTILGTICIVISGYIMWFASGSSLLLQWAYPIHAACALFMTALLIAHLYLGILHPDSNQALKGIFTGWVPAKFAYEHYEKWYDEEAKETIRG